MIMKALSVAAVLVIFFISNSVVHAQGGRCRCLSHCGHNPTIKIENTVRNEAVCKSACTAHGWPCYDFKPGPTKCGEAWTGWHGVGGGVGNPCPANCPIRGMELGKDYRSVGFPFPRPQQKVKFECYR